MLVLPFLSVYGRGLGGMVLRYKLDPWSFNTNFQLDIRALPTVKVMEG